jgi:hypothetical protein
MKAKPDLSTTLIELFESTKDSLYKLGFLEFGKR